MFEKAGRDLEIDQELTGVFYTRWEFLYPMLRTSDKVKNPSRLQLLGR